MRVALLASAALTCNAGDWFYNSGFSSSWTSSGWNASHSANIANDGSDYLRLTTAVTNDKGFAEFYPIPQSHGLDLRFIQSQVRSCSVSRFAAPHIVRLELRN